MNSFLLVLMGIGIGMVLSALIDVIFMKPYEPQFVWGSEPDDEPDTVTWSEKKVAKVEQY